jgi:hypothetical protein
MQPLPNYIRKKTLLEFPFFKLSLGDKGERRGEGEKGRRGEGERGERKEETGKRKE